MKTLWTPWRMAHVGGEAERVSGCLFEADLAAGATPEARRRHLVLFRDHQVVVFLNRFPYSNGHLLVAPARHLPGLADLEAGENLTLMAMLRESTAILQRHLRPDGFNIGCNLGAAAGAGIPEHLHFHLVPRWAGDHNFMTVLAEVRTIPEHIEATYQRLLPEFAALAGELTG